MKIYDGHSRGEYDYIHEFYEEIFRKKNNVIVEEQ